MQPDTTVYLVDSSIYVYRAWHLSPKSICNLDGKCVNAVHGFAEFLLQLLAQSKAQYLVCAFDHDARPSHRQTLYPDYKSGRSATPENLRPQFALCQELTDLMGICQISIPRFEADDIIGTLAFSSRADNKRVCVVSGDKDLVQCIEEGDVYWNFAKNQTLNKQAIEKRWGIRPSQMADLLALSGDKTDSIQGVPGIGEATAAKLLKKWGNLDVLFDHLADVAQMKFRGATTAAMLLHEHEQAVRRARSISGLFRIDGLPASPRCFMRTSINETNLLEFLNAHGFDKQQQADMLGALAPPA